jgi:hypothetical protein
VEPPAAPAGPANYPHLLSKFQNINIWQAILSFAYFSVTIHAGVKRKPE